MFADEFIDSSKNPMLPIIVPAKPYLPPIPISGSKATASINMVIGMKQTMKRVDIITTILVTFRLRLDNSGCKETEDDLSHSLLLRRLTTMIIVQIVTTAKAANCREKLLIMKEIFSTFSLSGLDTRPTSVLFLAGYNLLSSLLTMNTPDELNVRIKKTLTITRNIFLGVNIRFT